MRRSVPNTLILLGGLLLVLAGWETVDASIQQRRAQQVHALAAVPFTQTRGEASVSERRTDTPALDTVAFERAQPLFELEIPRIGLHQTVVYGTSREALRIGPGLLEGMPLPGTPGNSAIAAHRDRFFRRLGELERGDQILVSLGDRPLVFRIVAREVVKPTDVSVVAQTEEPTLTLITCWPIWYVGNAPERLALTAVLERD